MTALELEQTAVSAAKASADSDQPEGWALPTVGEILEINYGKGLKEAIREAGPVPVYGSNGIVGSHNTALTKGPSIIIGRKGTVGAVHFSPSPCWPIDTTYYIDQFPGIHLRYVLHALRSLDLGQLDTSTAIPGLNRNQVYAQLLPLPPPGEQKRIAEKVDQLLNQVNATRDRLAKVPATLKRFRQSVLAAACSGRLTAGWRATQDDIHPASELVERIHAGRESVSPRAQNQLVDSLPTAPSVLDSDDLDELPEMWVWAPFGSLIGELRNGIGTRPELQAPGHPMLRISSVRPGRVMLDDVRYLPHSDALVELYGVRDGDLLFTRYNGSLDLLGVCGMVRGLGTKTLLYPDKLMRVRFDHNWVSPHYAEIFFQSPRTRDRLIMKSKSSAGQQGLSGADIKAQPFALPTLVEQHEIVRRVGVLFNLAEAIEQRVELATARAEKMTRAILVKAVCGELVPTEAELARLKPATTSRRLLFELIERERADWRATGRPYPKG